jgi:UDP-N-acetylglucosamine--N-acetylmuramyl-(pentapeptide) pyrophosphoryl-undecaprenol N-acetylglucosamine transferase
VLLVFGGSQGARGINQVVARWVEQGIPSGLCILWATGKGQFDAYKQLDRADVRVVPYLNPIAEAYATADVALVRGGMMGTSEISAWGIPSVIVPLPTAANDHQTANAKVLESAGAAICLPQAQLSVARLEQEIGGLFADPARLAKMAAAAKARGRPQAAEEIARYVAAYL